VIDIGVAGLRATISWSGSASRYNVSYTKSGGQTVSFVQNELSFDIDNCAVGEVYSVSVQAVSGVGFTSTTTTSSFTIPDPLQIYPSAPTSFDAIQTPNGVKLTWTSVNDPMLYDYEIRYGTDWANSTFLGYFTGNTTLVSPLKDASYNFMIASRNIFFNISKTCKFSTLNISPPTAPKLSARISSGDFILSWTVPTSLFAIDHYVVYHRHNATVAATKIGSIFTTRYQSNVTWSGTESFSVAAVDVAGNVGFYAQVSLTITAPTAPTVTSSCVDNNVLLYWTSSEQTLPIDTYNIYKGDTFATAELIGTKSGLFTTVFESSSGNYTYWVAGVDTAGNVGTPGAITVSVAAPTNYVLHSSTYSTFNGTYNHSVLDEGAVMMPVDTTSTWASHFTSKGWSTFQDAINAGFADYAQPTVSSGYYEEVFDFGAVIGTSSATIIPTIITVAGSPAVTTTFQASLDGVTFGATQTSSAYLTNFRYIKVRVTVTSSDNLGLVSMTSLQVKLDLKSISDSGTVAVNATDANGTTVLFNQPFVDVTSISVTPKGTSALTAIYDFNGSAAPTSFKVYLYNAAGVRVSGTVSWAATGY